MDSLPDVVWGDIFAAIPSERQVACLRATCTGAVAGYDAAVSDGAVFVAAATTEWAAHVQSTQAWSDAFTSPTKGLDTEATVAAAASLATFHSGTFTLPRWRPVNHKHWCGNGLECGVRHSLPPLALVRVDVGAPHTYYRRRMRRHARWTSRSNGLYRVLIQPLFGRDAASRDVANRYVSWLQQESIIRRPIASSDPTAGPRHPNPHAEGPDFGHDLEDPFFSDDSDTPDELLEKHSGNEDAVRAHLARYPSQDARISLRSRLEGLNARHVVVCQTRASSGGGGGEAGELLPPGFLSASSQLKTITLLGLRSFVRVPDDFAANCQRLRCCAIVDRGRRKQVRCGGDDDDDGDDVDGSAHAAVPLVIGNRVLSQTPALHTLTIGRCVAARVVEIQAHFLSGSSRLQAIPLTSFHSLRVIHEGFLARAASIEHLDFTKCVSLGASDKTSIIGDGNRDPHRDDRDGEGGLTGMAQVPTDFLAHCRGLRSAPGLFGVVIGPATKRILHNVLENCRVLRVDEGAAEATLTRTRAEQSPLLLRSLELLGRSFCLDCSCLSEGFLNQLLHSTESAPIATKPTNYMDRIAIMSHLERLRTVVAPAWRELGTQFASGCPNLTRVDLIRASATLVRIMRGSFSECAALKELRISGLQSLQRIEGNVAAYCGHLESIAIEECPALASIDSSFARECKRLTSVAFRGPFPVLTTISSGFLQRTGKAAGRLTVLDLGPLVALVEFNAPHLCALSQDRRGTFNAGHDPGPIARFTAPGGATAANASLPLPASLNEQSTGYLRSLLQASCDSRGAGSRN